MSSCNNVIFDCVRLWRWRSCFILLDGFFSAISFISHNNGYCVHHNWVHIGWISKHTHLSTIDGYGQGKVSVVCVSSNVMLLEGHWVILIFAFRIGKRALYVKIPLGYSSWLLTALAIYYQEFISLTLVFGINIAFGITVFIFHCATDVILFYVLKISITLVLLFPSS